MSSRKEAQDTSWFTELLLSQPSDYAEPGEPQQSDSGSRIYSRAANFIALAVMGLVLAAAANLVNEGRPVVEQTRQELVDRVTSLSERTSALEQENARVLARNLQLERYVLPDIDNQLAAQLKAARKVGGYESLKGPGLVIELTNPSDADEYSSVYDVDLQVLVNALFAAGARGVAVDGIRVSAGTSIREAAGTILVDYKPVSSPYRLVAVGQRLRQQLKASIFQAWISDLESSYRIEITYKQKDSVTLPAGRIPTVEYAEEVNS